MIRVLNIRPRLTRAEGFARVALSCGIGASLLALHYINPETATWFPLRTSCGAFTGLPCIFCGTTRALHHLLNANFARALYFNWIAFPVAALAVVAALLCLAELAAQRRLVVAKINFRFTPETLGWAGGALAALWIFQVWLAVSLHKRELLNANAPLYAWFVR